MEKPTFEIPPNILSIETIRVGNKKIIMIGERHIAINTPQTHDLVLLMRLLLKAAMREITGCIDMFLEKPFQKSHGLYFAGGEFFFPQEQIIFRKTGPLLPINISLSHLRAMTPILKRTYGKRLRLHNVDIRMQNEVQHNYHTFEFVQDSKNATEPISEMNAETSQFHKKVIRPISNFAHKRRVVQHATRLTNTMKSIMFDWHKWHELDVPLANRPLTDFRSLQRWEKTLRQYALLRVKPKAYVKFFRNQMYQLRRIIAVRQRIRKEWEKIQLPERVKCELMPKKLLIIESADNMFWRCDIAMAKELDLYTFYRMLMTFRDEQCPEANTIIYYAGLAHTRNMRTMMKQFANVTNQPFHNRQFYINEASAVYGEKKVASPQSFAPVLRAISDWLSISYVQSTTPKPRQFRHKTQSQSAQKKRTKRRATEDAE